MLYLVFRWPSCYEQLHSCERYSHDGTHVFVNYSSTFEVFFQGAILNKSVKLAMKTEIGEIVLCQTHFI